MEIMVKRTTYSTNSTIGELWINGSFYCYTLEDVVRTTKIYGQTAIPAGRYQVVITYSAKFDQYMPLLLNVPNFEGVRIHYGNTAADTEGCILVGETRGRDFIGLSRAACSMLSQRLAQVGNGELIFITVQ